uniref:Transcription elongation factor Eaf N-terminal domain-containing protein n=1 Tax=Araucaria cunninghamii TaxID=56994 RepID=A0A0D6QUM3_ARACU
MANMKEPNTAPQAENWYPFALGSSLKAPSSTKFCSLRYEFKPASIDTSRPGSLQKSKENKVTVEFNNNQAGKAKVSFQGNIEECKDNDAVLFFDGRTFRLERLHKAVKMLRVVRLPGESAAVSAATSAPAAAAGGGAAVSGNSPPGASGLGRASKGAAIRTTLNSVPVAIERIDIGEPGSSSPAGKKNGKRTADEMNAPSPLFSSPEKSNDEEEHVDVDVDDEEDVMLAKRERLSDSHEANVNVDVDVGNDNDSDDEIADVDLSDDEADKGPNAAEALRAQVDAEENDKQQTSSSSGSSGSGSSGSATASSSSDSEGSDDDSASSGGDS